MDKPRITSVRSLRCRLGWAERELSVIRSGRLQLVSREWLEDALETRRYELENQIVIAIGIAAEGE